MKIIDYFDRIESVMPHMELMPQNETLMSQVELNPQLVHDEDINRYDVAIIGINDGKNAFQNEGVADAADIIRSVLYSLRQTSRELKVVDLGNIKGKTINDRYFVVKEICKCLSENNVVGIFIGGGQDYTFPMTQSLTNTLVDTNVCIVDSKLDIRDHDFSSQTFLSMMKDDLGDKILELSVLGVQNYFVGKSQEQLMMNESWEIVRLKELRGECITDAEPYIRDANLVSFDVGVIQTDFMPYFSQLNVNGFTGYEACQLAWYAGMSNQLRTFSLNEYNPELDENKKGAITSSEIIWHVLEGLSSKSFDIPSEESEVYKIFIVHLHNFNQDIRFYNNKYNNRWWIEVPWKEGVKLVSCNDKLYSETQNGELPEKWWKYFKKGSIDL